MKRTKGLIFLALLFLLIGAVSASEDANETFAVPDNTNTLEADTISMNNTDESDNSYEDDSE